MTSNQYPEVQASMLIRRPAHDVYEAFVDPKMLSRFWLSKASARLEAGKTVRWDFKIKGASADVQVKGLVPNRKIHIEWDEGVQVEWLFEEKAKDQTNVKITVSQIKGDWKEMMAYGVDTVQGFTIVLCELKALLEKDISLNLIYDKFPDAEHV